MAKDVRPGMDYYEYKRRHDERLKRERPQAAEILKKAEEALQEEAVQAQYKQKRSLLGGVKGMIKGFAPRAEEDDYELDDQAEEAATQPPAPVQPVAPAPEQAIVAEEGQEALDIAQAESPAARDAAVPLLFEEDDELDEAPDQQIDNPFADALVKLREIGGKAKGWGGALALKLKSRKSAQPEDARDEDESPAAGAEYGYADYARPASEEPELPFEPVQIVQTDEGENQLSRRARKAEKEVPASEAEVPASEAEEILDAPVGGIVAEKEEKIQARPESPVLAEPEEDEEEDEGVQRSRLSLKALLGSPLKTSANEADEDEEDDDIGPRRPFGLFGRRRAAPRDEDEEVGAQEEEIEARDEDVVPDLTLQLASAMEEEEALPSRRARRVREIEPKEEEAAPRRRRAPAKPEPEPEDEPEEAIEPQVTSVKDIPAKPLEEEEIDEPTQAFRPLRNHRKEKAVPARPVYEDDEDGDDDEEDVPVRGYVRRKPRKGAVRVYQDVDDDDYDDYDDDYEGDYEDDYEDDYDECEEDVGFGRRLLRFLKGLLIILLVILLTVLVLRQMESNGAISLNGLRSTVGAILPLDQVFPAPAVTATPEQLQVEPEASPSLEDAPASEEPAVEPSQDVSVGVELPGLNDPEGADSPETTSAATAEFLDETESPEDGEDLGPLE